MKSLFTPQPPWTFTLGMSIYHLLPFHAPITLFLTDAPFGRFASDSKSRWQVDGNKSWFIMEIVSPLTLLATLYFLPRHAWSTSSTILTSLFLVHYLHRAVLSPLVYSPARSKQHVIVPIIAGIYNLLNGHCIAIGLSHYGVNSLGPRYWLSVAGWAIGFAGNVYHDEVLNDLRRPAEKQLFTTAHPKELEKDKEASGGRYAIPRGGLFKHVSFPNYSCEWFEWLCFSIAAAPNPLISTPALSTLPEWLQRLFASTYYPSRLLHPSWMFFIFLLSSMYPRAVRSHRWYKEKFGDRYPDRKVVIPFVL